MKKVYYHICSTDNAEKISQEGLVCDDEGHIFVFDNLSIADSLNNNQLGHPKFSIIQIDSKGIFTELVLDNVSEFTASSQYICKQNKIESNYLTIIDNRINNPFETALKDNIKINDVIVEGFNNKNFKEKLVYLKSQFQKQNPKFSDFINKKISDLKK
ncbi:hypothetical protein SDC9_02297 [bioreactor metagenome]|uniref:Uncharacterized protein n=1 Tax=bioreactor metagenome TaxID=1076179 RepID=A0A644SR83_9ZZZZ